MTTANRQNTATGIVFPEVGEFLQERLVTDTRVYEVVGVTTSTIKLRKCSYGEVVKKENRGGNPWPCVWTEAKPDPDAKVRTVRLRKDGTFRIGSSNVLRIAERVNGVPAFYTDYRE